MEANFSGYDLFGKEVDNIGCVSDSTGFAAIEPSLEDNDFSAAANFICQLLMEENVEQRPFYDSLSLQVTEKSFYDALTGNIPLSPNQNPIDQSSKNEITRSNQNLLHENSLELKLSSTDSDSVSSLQLNPHAFPQPRPSITVSYRLSDLYSSVANPLSQNMFNGTDSVSQFRRGLEEASRFLPPGPNLVTCLDSKIEQSINVSGDNSYGLKGRKNHKHKERVTGEEEEEEEEGRSNKQSAVSLVDESDLSDAFDKFLSVADVSNDHNSLQSEPVKSLPKRRGRKKETVDMRNLLMMCAQAVYANDNRAAYELLKQIRQHSSTSGDASQRCAHYFANGLEARLVGGAKGAQGIVSLLSFKKITATQFLKAHQVFFSACPFRKFTYFFANRMIMTAAAKAETIHVIDFGILYGFQWSILINSLSSREGGPPNLRITGIELPQPGFSPSEIIEETGHRLANYCKRYNVPFEYNAIASSNWETIQVEALKIESNELVVVNSVTRLENLQGETFEENSPRNQVLQLIRKINPGIFTQSIVNGSYNSPFFAVRFREALFHYSAVYDMYDNVVPRENKWRMMLERYILGREAMNVIACEGSERVERPETYKYWQVRNTRAGFKQLPLSQELMAKFRSELKKRYHKDFVLDEDNNWLLQGWKGRILFASTCWVPA